MQREGPLMKIDYHSHFIERVHFGPKFTRDWDRTVRARGVARGLSRGIRTGDGAVRQGPCLRDHRPRDAASTRRTST